MTEETPRDRRGRHRSQRRQALTAPEDERLEQTRRLLAEQRAERRAARGRGRSRRAPAMAVGERRAAILEVAVPMLVEYGGTVKTSDIAAAAGIAEGTLFRAFQDKPALFRACLNATLESETEIGQIKAIDPALSLERRLTEAVRAVADFQNRLWSVAVALRTAGVDPRDDDGPEHDGPPKAMIGISAAIADLFDAGQLRIAPDLAARLLLGFVFSNRLRAEGMGESGAELGELVDVFLHGVLKGEDA